MNHNQSIFAQRVVMVRPAGFSFNRETEASNSFQKIKSGLASVRETALREFDAFVELLKSSGIEVMVWQEASQPEKPDAIFPNNWFSTHADGRLVLYPMFAPNRRLERDPHLINALKSEFEIQELLDLSSCEEKATYLEGTGSIVFDHLHRVAYACQSPRTSGEVLKILCEKIGYDYFLFNAFDRSGKPVYHTNVLMCFGEDLAVVCLESVPLGERENLITRLKSGNRKVVEISITQMENFAGNMLFLQSPLGKNYWVISGGAFRALEDEQRNALSLNASFLMAEIPCIENVGGGGVRCMLAENFLQKKSV